VPGISDSALAKKIESDTNEEQWQYFWPPPAPPSNLPQSPYYPSNLPPEVKKRILDGLHSHIRSDPDDETSVKAMGLWPSTCDYLINALELSGYTLNVNFWIFPYDWRQSNRISGKLLADFIEDKVGKANSAQHEYDDDGVDIINHSMGGFVTRAALSYRAPIKRVVYIASPHYGCPLSYFTLQKDVPFDLYPQYIYEPSVDGKAKTFDEQLKCI
jgi:lecithin:cholesterol acyltransferase